MSQERIKGVLSPVVTPFNGDMSPDAERFIRHCKWLVSQRVGLAVFGTNSEANSMSVEEKLELLAALVSGGVPAGALMPGTGHCALSDSIKMTREAVRMGCGGVLMLPPFYYKGVSDEGLFRNFSEVIERVGDERLRLYLYHIPPVSNVPITLNLIGACTPLVCSSTMASLLIPENRPRVICLPARTRSIDPLSTFSRICGMESVCVCAASGVDTIAIRSNAESLFI